MGSASLTNFLTEFHRVDLYRTLPIPLLLPNPIPYDADLLALMNEIFRVRQEEDAKRKSEEAARLAREAKLREKEKLQRVSGKQSCV